MKVAATIASFGIMIALGCTSLLESVVSKPKVSFASIAVRNATPEGATAVVALNVENPNSVSLTVDRLRYTLELGGHRVASAEIERVATIAARATSKVEIPVPFRYDQVFASVLDLIANGTAAFKITGSAKIGIFDLPFDHTGDLKLRE